MSLRKKVDFVRSAYFGAVSFIESGSQNFELRDKEVGEFTLNRHPDNQVSVWFMRSDGGCCGRYGIDGDARTTALHWLKAVINSIGYPKAQELREAVETELNTDHDDFCLTMSD